MDGATHFARNFTTAVRRLFLVFREAHIHIVRNSIGDIQGAGGGLPSRGPWI